MSNSEANCDDVDRQSTVDESGDCGANAEMQCEIDFESNDVLNASSATTQSVSATRKKPRRKKSQTVSSSPSFRLNLSESHVPPLDFSHYDLQSALQIVPVYNSQNKKPDTKLPSKSFTIINQGRVNYSRPQNEQEQEKPVPKSKTRSVRLNNNSLASTFGLDLVFQRILADFTKLTWLDLSFNNLSVIEESLISCSSLETLYLHSNRIFDIHEVKKISPLNKLRRLTLYGNPIEKHRSTRGSSSASSTYRIAVIIYLPQLLSLDVNAVTGEDRNRADNWQRLNPLKKPISAKKPQLDSNSSGGTSDA